MNRWLLLGVALGAVLAAAIAFSLQGADTPEPPPAGAASGTPPRAPSPGPSRASAPDQAPPPGPSTAPAPAPTAAAPASPAAPATVPGPGDVPPPPLADNPFATEDSRELDYAFQLVFGPDAGAETARAAIDVFERCLSAQPDNRRCYDGLVAAQQRQSPDWKPPPPPVLLAPPVTGAAPPAPTVPGGPRVPASPSTRPSPTTVGR